MGPAGGSCPAWDLVRFLARPMQMNFVTGTPLGGTTYVAGAGSVTVIRLPGAPGGTTKLNWPNGTQI